MTRSRGETIQLLTGHGDSGPIGGKARQISWLISKAEQVPQTWVVLPHIPLEDVRRWAERELDPRVSYAVRSSADAEDGATVSFAGQFATELDVEIVGIADAVARVRDSVRSERLAAYSHRRGSQSSFVMTVIVQPMVNPVASGVSFSRNPMTGLNEVVIEMVPGRGDLLVDRGVTPERWIHRWGGWTERPGAGFVSEEVASLVVEGTERIADQFGAPVDLEWVWDGDRVWWVQVRPITGLQDVAVYSNRISKEFLPGVIKPLVWSVNVPMVNRAWLDLFTEAIGPNSIDPASLAKSFAYRAYFNMGAIGDIFELLGMPRDSLELLLGLPPGEEQPTFSPSAATLRLLPRMLRVAGRLARYGKVIPGEVEELEAAFSRFDRLDLRDLSDSVLLADVEALSRLGVRAAYSNIVTPVLANLYYSIMRRRLGKAGLDPEAVELGSTDTLPDVDPTPHLERLAELAAVLLDGGHSSRGAYSSLPVDLRAEIDGFLDRFGHLSSSGNDFSVAPWRETPDVVVSMVLDHATAEGRAERIPWARVEQDLKPMARGILRRIRNRTQEFMEHRERVSFVYTYGYGLFRPYFLEIGRRLVDRGALSDADDVMYLHLDELTEALLGGTDASAVRELAAMRFAEVESFSDVVMPEVIYGDSFTPVRVRSGANSLSGIPTSRGRHRGTLRVVRDTSGFAKVEPGDVIAIPYSDVGWTPLFARAGAVIAEAGGMLSHSSIVAREYRVPCVVSVAGAMALPDGATVTVDGYSGTVVIESG